VVDNIFIERLWWSLKHEDVGASEISWRKQLGPRSVAA